MTDLLRNYLIQHASLSIPGLGTIYLDRLPAKTDFPNHRILPPRYQYRFDRYFDGPGRELFHYIAARKGIADFEAIRWYNEWAYSLSHDIRSNKPAILEGIGTLEKDLAGEIYLTHAEPVTLPLLPASAEKVIHAGASHPILVGDRQSSSSEMSEYLGEMVYQEKDPWWLYAVIITALLLLILFFHFFNQGWQVSSFGNQQPL